MTSTYRHRAGRFQTEPAPVLTVSPHLWFDHSATEAVAFYLSVFPDSEVLNGSIPRNRPGDALRHDSESMHVIDFRIGDLHLTAFNGGPHHEFNDSISLAVICPTQDEVDAVWSALSAGEGNALSCGWVRDKYGVSWQIVPAGLGDLLGHPDPRKAKRAVGALLGMTKIVLADIEAAMDP